MKTILKIILFTLVVCFDTQVLAAPQLLPLKGTDLISEKAISVTASKKALIIAFLSAKCPCSNSHTKELTSLKKDFPDFDFVAVHSNADESLEFSKTYFSKVNLPFSVIQDHNAKLADQFKALKTPHVFVLNSDGNILYQGGVSSSKNFDQADHKFLREALDDINNGRAVKNPEGRTLGCLIRGEKNVW